MEAYLDIEKSWSVTEHNFNDLALEIFHFQVKNNPVYAQYVHLIDKDITAVSHYTQIPFLPISFFKTHSVQTGTFCAETIFESSSTTGINTSKHHIRSIDAYHQNCQRIINQKINNLSKLEIFGLLPNYLERKNASLVSMVHYLMQSNQQPDRFYLYNHQELYDQLQKSPNALLFGVSYALLDFAKEYPLHTPLTIIETGGMKGRKKEITKEALYQELQVAFPNATILSEYGMTELMSQAYTNHKHRYTCPPWMKVLPRANNDPLSTSANGQSAALNIIDLANLDSCAFIATDDLGNIAPDGSFTVSGRLDNSDTRGCSLLAL